MKAILEKARKGGIFWLGHEKEDGVGNRKEGDNGKKVP
jgi:hypothetical protein